MSTSFKKEEVEVEDADPQQLYLLRSIEVPDWYVSERLGGWGRLASKNEALKQTQEWWLANLAEDWENHFTMENVEV